MKMLRVYRRIPGTVEDPKEEGLDNFEKTAFLVVTYPLVDDCLVEYHPDLLSLAWDGDKQVEVEGTKRHHMEDDDTDKFLIRWGYENSIDDTDWREEDDFLTSTTEAHYGGDPTRRRYTIQHYIPHDFAVKYLVNFCTTFDEVLDLISKNI
tara:strand:- start:40 stop:492 length:453 start_codon:yes stop_codon:yes gene_type:complete